jgi:hypothetical protein
MAIPPIAPEDTEIPPEGDKPSFAAVQERVFDQKPWLPSVGRLQALALLCGLGLIMRHFIYTPNARQAIAVGLALTIAFVASMYRMILKRVPAPGTWRPGDPSPEGIPEEALATLGPLFAGFRSRRWPGGASLEIARCKKGEGPHDGVCKRAGTVPEGRTVRVVVGEHVAQLPGVAGWMVAHELQHPRGWRCDVPFVGMACQFVGAFMAGWLVPWQWLPVAIVGYQALYTLIAWVAEFNCDYRAAKLIGCYYVLQGIAYRRAAEREHNAQIPPARRHITFILAQVSAIAPHPPWALRILAMRWAAMTRVAKGIASIIAVVVWAGLTIYLLSMAGIGLP